MQTIKKIILRLIKVFLYLYYDFYFLQIINLYSKINLDVDQQINSSTNSNQEVLKEANVPNKNTSNNLEVIQTSYNKNENSNYKYGYNNNYNNDYYDKDKNNSYKRRYSNNKKSSLPPKKGRFNYDNYNFNGYNNNYDKNYNYNNYENYNDKYY